jgi:hypothetical protein
VEWRRSSGFQEFTLAARVVAIGAATLEVPPRPEVRRLFDRQTVPQQHPSLVRHPDTDKVRANQVGVVRHEMPRNDPHIYSPAL